MVRLHQGCTTSRAPRSWPGPARNTPGEVFPHNCPRTKLEFLLGPQLVKPTSSLALRHPSEFLNSGLLHRPNGLGFLNARVASTFVARVPGTYTMICLVHGPIMSTTVTVKP